MGDLADTIAGVEDLLLFADSDTDEAVAVLDIGVQSGGQPCARHLVSDEAKAHMSGVCWLAAAKRR
jgi:hypothetical protein